MKLESQLATFELPHQQEVTELERKQGSLGQRLELIERMLRERLDTLEDILRHGIPAELKSLCDQQLAAIDERVTALNALETRVRESIKVR